MNETHVTVVGNVVADPVRRVTKSGDPYVTFRVASTVRRFDPATSGYVDVDTSFVDVRAFRRLALHVADSVLRGQPVVVSGRLRVREWTNGDRTGTGVEIDARAVGHDLTWGTASFRRERRLGEARAALTEAGESDDVTQQPVEASDATSPGAAPSGGADQAASVGVGDPRVDAYEVAS